MMGSEASLVIQHREQAETWPRKRLLNKASRETVVIALRGPISPSAGKTGADSWALRAALQYSAAMWLRG